MNLSHLIEQKLHLVNNWMLLNRFPTIEFFFNHTKLAVLEIKPYLRKNKIYSVKKVTPRYLLGPLVFHFDAYLTEPTGHCL